MPEITQLYEKLEIFTEGEPPRHTLFIMGSMLGTPDQLLLIDPPDDVAERFSLADNSAVLFTVEERDIGLQQVETQPGGVAHVRVGQHLLDIYSHKEGNVIYLPAVGLLCAGKFGSDLALPELAPGSDGEGELAILRLLAKLAKGARFQLLVPRTGSLCDDSVEAMTRLANDVAYFHGLRRVIPAAARRGDSLKIVRQLAQTLLPEARQNSLCGEIHRRNVERLFKTSQNGE